MVAMGSGLGVVADAVAKVGEVAEEAKKSLEGRSQLRAEEKVEAYKPVLRKALKGMDTACAKRVLRALGDSPVPLTSDFAKKVKSTFPIPKEQTVIWADAEFDLRPSGVVATDRGVFIKADAKALDLGKVFTRKGEDDSAENGQSSNLSYFTWENFEPAWFVSEDPVENVALSVAPECSGRFVSACRSMKSMEDKLRSLRIERLARSLDGGSVGMASTIAASDVLIGEEAVFVEQRAFVNNPGGHGEMAESASNMFDAALGREVEWIGPGNAKDGADRVVDGVFVQTKYYKTARGSLESCFDPETGLYRYVDESGECMQLEVAKDQYERVLELFKKKIEQDKVPGVHDPAEAERIVRKGWLTHEQAVNLTKFGTIESLAYDVATGAVICSSAFGITFLAASFSSYRKTRDVGQAVQAGISAGVQVFGVTFIQHIVVSQLSRTGLSGMLMAPSELVVEKLGRETSAVIVNGLRALMGKSAIGGAAASKQLAKILRSNAVTAAATFVIFSAPETYRLVSGKCSGAQYAKGMASLVASIAGGAGGAVAAGAAAAKVAGAAGTAVAPGVGTAIGVAGGFVGGAAAATATNAVGGIFHEGDGATFSRLFNAMVSVMAFECMLDDREVDEVVERLNAVPQKDFGKLMDSVFSSERQEECIRRFLEPIFDDVIARREKYELPSYELVGEVLRGMA